MEKSNLSLEALENHFNKLEDIKNSFESLVQKIGQLQVDLFNNPDKDLEKFLNPLNSDFSKFHQEVNDFTNEYRTDKLLPARGLEVFNSAEEEAEGENLEE